MMDRGPGTQRGERKARSMTDTRRDRSAASRNVLCWPNLTGPDARDNEKVRSFNIGQQRLKRDPTATN